MHSSRSVFISCDTRITACERSSSLRIRARALSLKRRVADPEGLVDQQDLGIDLGGDAERQPHVHPAGVVLQREVGELAQAGELVDPLHLGQHLAPGEAEHRPVEQDVVEARELGD